MGDAENLLTSLPRPHRFSLSLRAALMTIYSNSLRWQQKSFMPKIVPSCYWAKGIWGIDLRVCANHGALPSKAYKETMKKGEGISGHVIATGKSLLIRKYRQFRVFKMGKNAQDPNKSVLSSPFWSIVKSLACINVNGQNRNVLSTGHDLNLLDIVGPIHRQVYPGESIAKRLRSRFAQMALVDDANKSVEKCFNQCAQDPDKMAKIVAKSFYRKWQNLDLALLR